MEQEFILMIQKAQQLHYKLMKISCLLLEKIHKVKTTGLAGGLFCPYKGLLPAYARKAY